ncbi:MAG: hypothetical protein JSU83_13580 [Deltaproteobacteria bacterium]|nr:MAG: hypothetical protein JSU83_13580 [Deltaproteobacteria bacterium]
MTKREKIIVFLMVLSLIYGVYVFFIESPPKMGHAVTTSKLDTFNQFITNIAEMTKDGLSEIDAYIIQNISAKWTKDPLLNTRKDFDIETEKKSILSSLKTLGIAYNGFLKMGNQHLAIINGVEYETGEELEKGGFTIGKIYPNRVIIISRSGKEKISIPLEEIK